MFETFGEFDSCEELNRAAEGLRTEGDFESLKKLAEENGIPLDEVDRYCDGETDNLCTPVTAALGKLEIESKELKPQQIEKDWIEYIQQTILENEDFARSVRKKNKSLFGCEGEILKYAHDNMFKPHDKVLKAAGVGGQQVKLGMPGWAREKKIIKTYYLEAKNE